MGSQRAHVVLRHALPIPGNSELLGLRSATLSAMLAPLLLLASVAFNPNGTDLRKQCRLYVRAREGAKLEADEMYQAGVCFGFLGGTVQGLNTMKVSCPPSTSTLNTMVRIYLAYMEAHPKALDFDRSMGVYGAMKEAYPCPAK